MRSANPPFSERERQVVEQILTGSTYSAIAHHLHISQHTVDTYVRRIKLKLGAGNRSELIVSALEVLHGRT